MSTKEQRKDIFIASREACQLTRTEWARLFNLGQDKGYKHVYEKETDVRGVNLPEALAAQLLAFLNEQNFDVKNAIFDPDGHLLSIPPAKDK